MQKKVIGKIIDSGLIREGATIIVGFSGGPDSLCLLHALKEIEDIFDLNIVPVHINHNIRKEANFEAENCAKICEKFGLECLLFGTDCAEMAKDYGVSLEEAGRLIRYDIFNDVAAELQSQGIDEQNILIATAHNADDQSETVLFRLIRGTGIHGLAGIPEIRPSEDGYMIIRPLLKITRDEIEEYIKENKLHPNIDKSNFDSDYSRNKIRNELIPYIEKNYNPNIKEVLRRYAEIADVDDMAINEAAYEALADNVTADEERDLLCLDIKDLQQTSPAINRRVMSIILTSLRLDTKSSYELIVSLMNLIYSDNPSAIIDLPDNYKAMREYEKIIISDNMEVFKTKTKEHKFRLITQVMMRKEYKPDSNQIYAAFDFDKFNDEYPGKVGEIKLRFRQDGDYIAIKDGKKKIQDFFVDEKVKKSARDIISMVCIDDEILWILPNDELNDERLQKNGKYSQKFHIDDTTERVLFLEISNIL